MNGSNISLSHKTLVRLVSHLAGLYPNPDDPDPIPWGPVIRKALERVRWAAGPLPDPWVWAALNPQPLPPRYAAAVALGQAVVDQVGSLEEMAQALPEGSRDSIAAYTKGFIGRFVDDCGNGHIVIRIPKGGPYPQRWPLPARRRRAQTDWPGRNGADRSAVGPLCWGEPRPGGSRCQVDGIGLEPDVISRAASPHPRSWLPPKERS